MRPMTMANQSRYYVSLGDSMSIDAYAGGAGRGAASLLFQNRNDDFPDWQGCDIKTVVANSRLIPLAQDGATSATVRYAQIPRMKEMGVRPSLVTVTMGGNDLLQCFGSDEAAQSAHRSLWDHANAVLLSLRELAGPNTPVLVGTIYDPSDGSGNAEAAIALPWPNALTWIRLFNQTLHAVAGEHGAIVADIHGAFQGHGIQAGDTRQAESRPQNRALFYCGGIEPNAWGAGAIRGVWWETLRNAGFWSAVEA